ncbi:MAG TPA: LysE family translocator [Hyphomicrobiaceae bacterium]|nr:LysE family translocator [Hyphomicrobiaceae bacterium]
MPADLLLGLVVFCWVTGVTPGPNNIMLLSSGLTYGSRATLPHLMGVAVGFAVMVALVGLGIGRLFEAWPALYAILKIAGALYLLYLAWMIATAGAIEADGQARGRPMTFIEAALFQWVNPKGWVMAVGSVTTYAGIANFPANVALIAAMFGTIGVIASGVWMLFGELMKRWLTDPRRVRAFNIAMALGLVLSLWPVVADVLPEGVKFRKWI